MEAVYAKCVDAPLILYLLLPLQATVIG
jgi:hypothetical protein